jgi:hypothetical protein
MLGQIVVRMVSGRRSLLVKFAVKLVPALRKRIKPCHALEINKVVRFLGILERELRRTPPAVRLGTKIGELRNRMPEESGHLGGNFLGRNAIYVFMSFVAPT